MRVVRLITITNIQPAMFMKWIEAVQIYLEKLPGNTLSVVSDGYSPGDENILKN